MNLDLMNVCKTANTEIPVEREIRTAHLLVGETKGLATLLSDQNRGFLFSPQDH